MRVQISFSGLNAARALNQLSQITTLLDVKKQGKNCQITVPAASYKQVVAFLQEKCYNVTQVRHLGAGATKIFLRAHFILPVFLVLSVALLALSSNFCWNVEVTGDYASETVISALDELHVGVGRSLFNFSADRLENQLAVKLDAMYAVVNRKGSALYVNVVKSKQVDEPINMHARRDIVATVDGTVTDVLCEQGTSVVKVGDVVKKGDPLILGLRTFSDGTTADAYALGVVTLEQSCTAFTPYTGFANKTVETGKTFKVNHVVLFGKCYGKLPPFENYRAQYTTTRLYPLGVQIRRVTYYETQQVSLPATLEQCLPQLKELALQIATDNADFVITRTEYTVSESGVAATVYGAVQVK